MTWKEEETKEAKLSVETNAKAKKTLAAESGPPEPQPNRGTNSTKSVPTRPRPEVSHERTAESHRVHLREAQRHVVHKQVDHQVPSVM